MSVRMECGRLPGRKLPCLWLIDGNCVRVLASFKSDEALQKFLAMNPLYTVGGREESA